MKLAIYIKSNKLWTLSAFFLVISFMLVSTYSVHAGDKVSYGMTKIEVFEAKGTPDKINRLPDEPGKEMWVYKCMGDDGYNDDCLYLYFDGDTVVKIERP